MPFICARGWVCAPEMSPIDMHVLKIGPMTSRKASKRTTDKVWCPSIRVMFYRTTTLHSTPNLATRYGIAQLFPLMSRDIWPLRASVERLVWSGRTDTESQDPDAVWLGCCLTGNCWLFSVVQGSSQRDKTRGTQRNTAVDRLAVHYHSYYTATC